MTKAGAGTAPDEKPSIPAAGQIPEASSAAPSTKMSPPNLAETAIARTTTLGADQGLRSGNKGDLRSTTRWAPSLTHTLRPACGPGNVVARRMSQPERQCHNEPMTPSPQGASISRRPDVVGTDVGDLHVVLNEDLRYLGLDAVATRVWELLESPQTLDELATTLQSEYEVDDATCRRDLGVLVDTFVAHKLVSVG